MIEKTCFDRVPPFDESLFVYEDFVMALELSLHYPFYHLPEPLSWFTWREDGTSMSSTRDFTSPLKKIYEKFFPYAQDQVWVATNINAILQARGLQPMFQIVQE